MNTIRADDTVVARPPQIIPAADDPVRAGVAAAVRLGRAFVHLDGVVGVNFSGGTAPGSEVVVADGLAQISEELTA